VVYGSDEWELTDVNDVHEAVDWAEANADGRTYTLYVCVDSRQNRGLVQLAGVDPTDPEQLG
jgi:hypothetical protein